jgi:plastocyanin
MSSTRRTAPHRVRTIGGVVAITIGAFGLAGCSSGGSTPDASAVACPAQPAASVDAKDSFRFSPDKLSLKAGTVVVRLHEVGSLPHTFQIRGVSGKAVVNSATKEACAKFTLAAGQTYTFFCGVTGHEAAGMHGTITVS